MSFVLLMIGAILSLFSMAFPQSLDNVSSCPTTSSRLEDEMEAEVALLPYTAASR
jgi:hypothetical protein